MRITHMIPLNNDCLIKRVGIALNVTIIIRRTVVILGNVPMDADGTLHSRCYRFITLTDVVVQQESLGIKSNH